MDKPSKGTFWAGWILSGLIGAMFIMGSSMALMHSPEAVKGFTGQFGYPEDVMLPLGITQLLCVIIFLIPRTCILGGILMTGYLGGAVATHVRVHDNFIAAVVFGVFVWLALYLREPRLRALIPLKS